MSRTFRPPISVFLAHPNDAVRVALGDEIAGTGITVIGESSEGRDTLERVLDQVPDVALLATDLDGLSGAAVCAELRTQLPACRVLLLADNDETDTFDGCLAGALGCYLIDAPQVPLVKAVRGAMRRESLPTRSWSIRILEQFESFGDPSTKRRVPTPTLTVAEREVLTRMTDGESPLDISEAQATTTHMVRVHAGNAIAKLVRALNDQELIGSVAR